METLPCDSSRALRNPCPLSAVEIHLCYAAQRMRERQREMEGTPRKFNRSTYQWLRSLIKSTLNRVQKPMSLSSCHQPVNSRACAIIVGIRLEGFNGSANDWMNIQIWIRFQRNNIIKQLILIMTCKFEDSNWKWIANAIYYPDYIGIILLILINVDRFFVCLNNRI